MAYRLFVGFDHFDLPGVEGQGLLLLSGVIVGVPSVQVPLPGAVLQMQHVRVIGTHSFML